MRDNWARLLFLAFCIPAFLTGDPALVMIAGAVGLVLWPFIIAG